MTIRPPFKRRQLGRRLRAMRERARLTMEEASRKLDMSRTSLCRIESGEYRASVHLIRSMMDIYDCYIDGLLDDAREAPKAALVSAVQLIQPELPETGICRAGG